MSPTLSASPPAEPAPIPRVGVIGVGTMGQGIVQWLAQGGVAVALYDHDAAAATRAMGEIAGRLDRLVAKGMLAEGARREALARIEVVDQLAGLAGCGVVVEAIIEDLTIKQALFVSLEELLGRDVVLATNTSSLSVTAVAARCRHPERVVGWHFFNPVPLMRLAEVVRGERTDARVAEQLMQLTRTLGHHPVLAEDSPGFVVNHAGRAFIPEGLRLLSEGIAAHDEIDHVMREVAGFRMGPFELFDLIGLDVGQRVMESLYHQYYEEPRFRITPLVARKVAAGRLGRKSGEGFYRYGESAIENMESAPGHDTASLGAGPTLPVWLSPAEPDLAQQVRERLGQVPGWHWETGERPSAQALTLATPVGDDASTTCLRLGLDPRRTVAIDALFSLERRAALMAAPGLAPECREAATALCRGAGLAVSWLNDSPGFVAQRIVAQIIQVGADMAQHRVASPEDIEASVVLGLGYPLGPFGLARRIGPRRALQISQSLHLAYGEARYRPSIWLRRRAELDLPLETRDA